MKARNPSTGTLETVYVKALDSMPVGTEVDFDGNSADIPAGWEEVNGWKIGGQTTASNYIEIPNNASELFIVTEESNSQLYSKYFSTQALKDNHYMYDGYYLTSSNYAGCAWQYKTANGIKCAIVQRTGTDYTSSSTTTLYYR